MGRDTASTASTPYIAGSRPGLAVSVARRQGKKAGFSETVILRHIYQLSVNGEMGNRRPFPVTPLGRDPVDCFGWNMLQTLIQITEPHHHGTFTPEPIPSKAQSISSNQENPKISLEFGSVHLLRHTSRCRATSSESSLPLPQRARSSEGPRIINTYSRKSPNRLRNSTPTKRPISSTLYKFEEGS